MRNLLQDVRSAINSGDGVRAVKLLREAKLKKIEDPEFSFLEAVAFGMVARYEEAVAKAREQLKETPTHEGARNILKNWASAIAAPSTEQIPWARRSWNTSIPKPLLRTLQLRLHNFSYRGIPLQKNPFDLAIYSALLWELRPGTIFEIGSKNGGSAVWFADQIRSMDFQSKIFSVDVVPVEQLIDPLVTFLEGDGRNLGQSFSPSLLSTLRRPWLIIDDADHSFETTDAVLRFFDGSLIPGDMIIIEDGIGTDLHPELYKDGLSHQHRAIRKFLEEKGDSYEMVARYCDFFGYNVTWCTNGFLRKLL
jgi:cephalosporin hydroxylase